MKIQKFEDILAWQKSQNFAVEIYAIFSGIRDFGFKDQILRASVSISNNIAEGFDRISNADFARFLYISLGSCSEVKSMIYLAEKLGYLSKTKQIELIENSNEISKITRGLIKSLSKK